MTREDRDHEIADQVTYLDDLYDAIRARVAARGPAEASRVRLRVLGFSQGVATVGRWLGRGRTRADELILWAGSFPTDVDLTSLAARLDGASVVLVGGSRDELASWADAEGQRDRFREAGIAARLVTFDGGHRLDEATLVSIANAPESAPLQAHPDEAGTGPEPR
jgi:predicted esterase